MGPRVLEKAKCAPKRGIYGRVSQMWTLVPGPENYCTLLNNFFFVFLSTQAPPHRINYFFSSPTFYYYKHD